MRVLNHWPRDLSLRPDPIPSPDVTPRPETGPGAPCLPSTLLAAKTAATQACSDVTTCPVQPLERYTHLPEGLQGGMLFLPEVREVLPEVREFIKDTRPKNKHDTGWAEGAPPYS